MIIPLNNFTLHNTLIHKGDLIYYEGAMLSHFIDRDDKHTHYFYKWSDVEINQFNRWMIFKVSEIDLYSFFNKELNLLDLIYKNDKVYFIDTDDNIEVIAAYEYKVDDIPDDYLPSTNSYYDEYNYEKYAKELIEKINLIDYKIESLPLNLEFQGNIFKDYDVDVYTEHYIDKNTNEHVNMNTILGLFIK